jgi:hypothetical protein
MLENIDDMEEWYCVLEAEAAALVQKYSGTCACTHTHHLWYYGHVTRP